MLAQLQQQLIHELIQRTDTNAEAPNATHSLLQAGKLSECQQLEIYRRSSLQSLNNSLSMTYPVCKIILGETQFDEIATTFIQTHHSIDPNLNNYGRELSWFIQQNTVASHLPFLSDLANFEWAWLQAYYSLDQTPASILEDIEKVPESEQLNIIFCLSPSTSLLHSHYPILDIWQAHQNPDQEMQNTGNTKIVTDNIYYNPETHYWILDRIGLEVRVHPLSQLEFKFFDLIQNEKTLSTLVDTLTKYDKDFSFKQLLLDANNKGYLAMIRF